MKAVEGSGHRICGVYLKWKDWRQAPINLNVSFEERKRYEKKEKIIKRLEK
jgi:hypothetical protein